MSIEKRLSDVENIVNNIIDANSIVVNLPTNVPEDIRTEWYREHGLHDAFAGSVPYFHDAVLERDPSFGLTGRAVVRLYRVPEVFEGLSTLNDEAVVNTFMEFTKTDPPVTSMEMSEHVTLEIEELMEKLSKIRDGTNRIDANIDSTLLLVRDLLARVHDLEEKVERLESDGK